MFRTTVFCSVALTLLSSAAMAVVTPPSSILDCIWECQEYTVGATNIVLLDGAGGCASNINTATIFQVQNDTKLCAGASQNGVLLFIQDGKASGLCGGLMNVQQIASGIGGQIQFVGDGCGIKTQSQGLGLTLVQGVQKIDGSGGVSALHSLGSVQTQNANNSAGTMYESNVVAAGQVSAVSGGPSTTGTASGTLTVSTNQTAINM